MPAPTFAHPGGTFARFPPTVYHEPVNRRPGQASPFPNREPHRHVRFQDHHRQ